MCKYYLAVDIGASSGRHILGSIVDGKMKLEEIYRFENGMKRKNGKLVWDHVELFQNIVEGMKKCKEMGKIPVSMGIDTWGVDFVLLDEEDNVIGDMVGYRDTRTKNMEELVENFISMDELYQRTGIQKMSFNTIYQLMALKEQNKEQLEQAKTFLFVPDYFHYLLTGEKVNEYTEASTSQLINPSTRQWDKELMEMLGLPKDMLQEIAMPGSVLGNLKKELQEEVGFDTKVILPCSHDTGSAVLAVPANDDDFVYISSGTWSLLGVERDVADCSELSRNNNFTNEGGYEGKIRYLRNIMGLWMIQSVRHNLNDAYSFAQICEQAEEAKDFPSRVDVNNDDYFMAPDNMIDAVKKYCQDSKQQVPETLGEVAIVVYASLAQCYAKTIEEVETSTGKTYSRIHIVGGGANAGYLNELTARATKKEVHAGPTEATAIGNLTAQMIANKEFQTKEEAREMIYHSFEIKVYNA